MAPKPKPILQTAILRITGPADAIDQAVAVAQKLFPVKIGNLTATVKIGNLTATCVAVGSLMAGAGEAMRKLLSSDVVLLGRRRKGKPGPKPKIKGKAKAKGKPGPKPKAHPVVASGPPKAKLPKGAFTAAVYQAIESDGPVGIAGIVTVLINAGVLTTDNPKKNGDRVSAVALTLKAKGQIDGSVSAGYMVADPEATVGPQAGTQSGTQMGPGTVSLAPSAATAATEE